MYLVDCFIGCFPFPEVVYGTSPKLIHGILFVIFFYNHYNILKQIFPQLLSNCYITKFQGAPLGLLILMVDGFLIWSYFSAEHFSSLRIFPFWIPQQVSLHTGSSLPEQFAFASAGYVKEITSLELIVNSNSSLRGSVCPHRINQFLRKSVLIPSPHVILNNITNICLIF